MQETIFYVAAGETVGTVRDYANAKTVAAPTLVRGVAACLRMRLFARKEGLERYPADALDGIVRWQWAMDSDFNEATSYKLQADNSAITIGEVEDDIDGDENTYTEFRIPIPEMNSEELSTWIGTDKSKSGLHGELVGYNAEGAEVFILQVENFTLRNRITSLGSPTPVSADYLTASQVAALVAAGLECQFSADGEAWHGVQGDGEDHVRFRFRNTGGVWTEPVRLQPGPQGEAGRSSYTYVAYASSSGGDNFSMTPSNALKFRAEIQTDTETEEFSPADFAGKWVKYIGDDGAGAGDMKAADYDPDGDGVVDHAKSAENADSVSWEHVAGAPETFPPAAHSHGMDSISDPVRQTTRSEANPSTLYLNKPVLLNSAAVNAATLNIDFTSVKTVPGGDAYTGVPGDMLTWEYHVKATREITSVAVGSLNSSMTPVGIPDTLPLAGGNATWHVFTVRGIYRSGVPNNLTFQINYCYSYEA